MAPLTTIGSSFKFYLVKNTLVEFKELNEDDNCHSVAEKMEL
jgi:hypothetical protein